MCMTHIALLCIILKRGLIYKSYLHISTNGVFRLSCSFIGYINTISIEDPPIGQGANSVIRFTLITDPSDVGLFKINSTTVSINK